MDKKKIIVLLLILIIVGLLIYFICSHVSISNEDAYSNYTPQEEISEESSKETPISLYFLDKESNKLKSSSKMVKVSDLLKDPYRLVVQELIKGPSDEKLITTFPENTRLIDATFSENCVTLNFSEDLLNFKDDTQKFNIINSILNSLSQLTEVNSIKILINNEPNQKFDGEFSTISEKP